MALQSNDFEMVDFLLDKFKMATGIGEPRHRPPARRYKHETQTFNMEGARNGMEINYQNNTLCTLTTLEKSYSSTSTKLLINKEISNKHYQYYYCSFQLQHSR